jgi:integrase
MAFQTGYLFKKSGSWYVRYRENGVDPKTGEAGRVQTAKKLGTFEDYPRKQDILPVLQTFMNSVNQTNHAARPGMKLKEFVDEVYLPELEGKLKATSVRGYTAIWNTHIKSLPEADMQVRSFQTHHVNGILARLGPKNLAHNYYLRIKSFLSAVFKAAKRYGIYVGVNPVVDTEIPKGKVEEATYAYSLNEVYRMIQLLPPKAKVAVAVAGLAGLRKGEIMGITLENYDGATIYVEWEFVEGKFDEPKSRQSKDYVPVIPLLKKIIEENREWMPATKYLIESLAGTPMNLDNLANRTIKPLLMENGIKWHGWHAFRRGLATNLHELGVDDLTIQKILRHEDVSTTRKSYIKQRDEKSVEAMGRVEKRWEEMRVEEERKLEREGARLSVEVAPDAKVN